MVVCMSRRICADLQEELVRLRPDWRDEDDDKGRIKVVMTGSASDPPEWQQHIRNKKRRERLAQRFRDPGDPLDIVVVRGHVVDRVRRAQSPHDVRGQADARPRADAGDRSGEPRLPGQAGAVSSWTTSASPTN